MAEAFYPFDNSAVTTELQWSRMMRILMPDGVDAIPVNSALRVEKTGNLTCNVLVGNAWVRGFYYTLDTAAKQLTFAVNAATTARIDMVVLRVDWDNNNMTPVVLQGTAAASPVPPAITKNESLGIFDLPLAEVRVENNDVISTVTDRRRFIGRPIVYCASDNRPDPEGRPILAFETNTNRMIYNSGSGAWNVGLGDDIYRPLYAYSGDSGYTSTTTAWDTTLTDSATPSLVLSFTAPPSGRAMIRVGAFLANNTSDAAAYMAVRVRDAGGGDYWAFGVPGESSPDRVIVYNGPFKEGVTYSGSTCAGTFYAATLTPNTRYTVTLGYRASSGTAQVDDRWIEVQPLP